MAKHKYNIEKDKYICGWCAKELPRTASGGGLAAMRDTSVCSRITPAMREAVIAERAAVAEEITKYLAAGESGVEEELSDSARIELNRRRAVAEGRKTRRTFVPLLAALSALAVPPPRR